jgi:hypothetical protein
MNKTLLGGIKGTHTYTHLKACIIWIFNHCPYRTMMLFSRTRGPGSLQQIQLHYLAVCRQVHSCSYLLFIFIKLLANVPVVLLLLHAKEKVLFSQLIWLVVSNHGGCRPRMVGSGTMVCMMVEVPLQLEYSPRTNNQCRQWFLCHKIRSTIGSRMGRRSQLYLFPLAYQWTRRSVAVVSLRGASGRVESL